MDARPQCVFVANGEVQAQQVRTFLEAAGIASSLSGESLRHTHGLTLDGAGAVQILVSAAHAEHARSLLAAAESGQFRLSEDGRRASAGSFRDLDTDKLAEAALAILSLTLHDNGRVWKSLDWDLLDLLWEKGWVVEARTKAKSVVLTEEGERLAREFLRKHFSRATP